MTKTIRMVEEFLDEVSEFIEKLITGQSDDEKVYKADADFSADLQHYLNESSFIVQ